MATKTAPGTAKPVAEKAAPPRPAASASTPAKHHTPPPAFLQPPRDTTEHPWRDLHPARVWPD
jgi:hypothetical protein